MFGHSSATCPKSRVPLVGASIPTKGGQWKQVTHKKRGRRAFPHEENGVGCGETKSPPGVSNSFAMLDDQEEGALIVVQSDVIPSLLAIMPSVQIDGGVLFWLVEAWQMA